MPNMISVTSSNVEAIGYDSNKSELHVRFNSGGYYIYHNVPENVFDAFMASSSKGSFLHHNIKGIYTYTTG